jgi:hypothetical protein
LIAFVEDKFRQHGIAKVIPGSQTLAKAFRRAAQIGIINHRLPEIIADAAEVTREITVPGHLEKTLRAQLAEEPKRSWDDVLGDAAEAEVVRKRAKQRPK